MVITDGKLAFLFQKNLMVEQLDDKGDSEQLDDKGYSLEDKRDPCPELCCHGGRRRGLLTESNHPLVPDGGIFSWPRVLLLALEGQVFVCVDGNHTWKTGVPLPEE